MSSKIEYRELTDFEEFYQIEEIQTDSWDVPERELVPKRIPYATFKSGGVVIGAYEEDLMIGYVWGWVGYNKQYGNYIYSHHNAVRKEYQNRGIGFQLKSEQRKWSIKNGFSQIKWVFDPLQTKNVYLNIHKLGATCNSYKINYWLELKDELNEGIETDRFFCNWDLESEHVKNHLNQKHTDFSDLIKNQEHLVINTKKSGVFLEIQDLCLDFNIQNIGIEVPSNFIEMKKAHKSLAIDWRLQTRTIFQNYFKKGYKVIDFVIKKEQDFIRCFHILER
ncbi:MAG: GNAT family N-acetyltransferase [Candidatus Heimdallarchaeota archaeon]|nr:GNAT family N-acetyltransferase [Candidatus Heimdallarchaeota archaeon]